MFFIIMCAVITLLFIILPLSYYLTQRNRYAKIKEYEEKIVKELHNDIQEAAKNLLERKYRYIQNYFIFLLTNKVFGLISITFSILGLIALSSGTTTDYKWLEYIVCFVSIIFVVLALYLTPVSKVFQYISAWRMCDKKMCEIIASRDYYRSLNPNDKTRINKIAVSISNVITAAEESLTTEGE